LHHQSLKVFLLETFAGSDLSWSDDIWKNRPDKEEPKVVVFALNYLATFKCLSVKVKSTMLHKRA